VKPRTVAVLAVLVAALAAFLWFVDRDLPSSEKRAEQSKKILPIDAEKVSEVTIDWQGQSVRMEKGAEQSSSSDEAKPAEEADSSQETEDSGAATSVAAKTWRLVAPLQARADGTQVDRLLEALGALERSRTLDDADPVAVGLDSPRGQVTVTLAEDGGRKTSERTLRVGDAVPTSDDVVVSVSSGDAPAQTYVTSGSFLSQLQRDPGDWRDKDVFTGTRSAVERLTLSTGAADSKGSQEKPIVLARRDRRFRIEQPVSDVADPHRVDTLLSQLVSLRVERFIDSPESAASEGLAPPRRTLVAALEGGKTFRLELGDPVSDLAPGAASGAAGAGGKRTVYAKVGDQVFTASTELPSTLSLPASSWRSPAWTAVEGFQVERLDVTQGETSFTLRRDGVDWMRGEDTIAYSKASDLLSAITGAEGEVVDQAAPKTALLTVKLTPQEGDPVTLSLYPASSDGSYLAGSSDRTALVRLSKETASGIVDAVAAARDAAPEKGADDEPPAKEDDST